MSWRVWKALCKFRCFATCSKVGLNGIVFLGWLEQARARVLLPSQIKCVGQMERRSVETNEARYSVWASSSKHSRCFLEFLFSLNPVSSTTDVASHAIDY